MSTDQPTPDAASTPDAVPEDALPDTQEPVVVATAEAAPAPDAAATPEFEIVPEQSDAAAPAEADQSDQAEAEAPETVAEAAQPDEEGSDAADAVEDAPATTQRLGRLLNKKSLIIAGAGITPVIVGAIAFALLRHDPEPPATVPQQWAAAISTTAAAPPPASPTPPPEAPAANAADQAPSTEQTLEQQAAELAEVHKQLAEERARRIAAENSAGKLRVAEASQPAFSKPKAGGPGGKPSRRFEDCNVERGSFAETLKACIEEFNRMPQSR